MADDFDLIAYLTDIGRRLAAIERMMGIYVQGNADKIPTADIITIHNAFYHWESGGNYAEGAITKGQTGDQLYRLRPGQASSGGIYEPSAAPTVWEPVVMDHAGTIDDPIPWVSSMTAYKGKYYTEGGKTYRCKRDDTGSGTALYYTIAELLGDYFEEATV